MTHEGPAGVVGLDGRGGGEGGESCDGKARNQALASRVLQPTIHRASAPRPGHVFWRGCGSRRI